MKAIILDFYGVLYRGGDVDQKMIKHLQKYDGKYKLAILSNMGRRSFNNLLSVRQQRLFDVVALSGESDFYKPQREAYDDVVEKLGVSAAECLFIDDNRANVFAAELMGMPARQYVGEEKFYKDLPDA